MTKKRILVIDDDKDLAQLLKLNLERTDLYEVMIAFDGEEGINMFRVNPTPLVITDIIMPNKEGMELICELQQEYPDVKIIVMSGGGKVEAELYLENASKIPNVKATLKKPFEINDLLRVIKNIGE